MEGCDARDDVVAFECFDDSAYLACFDAWLATAAGVARQRALDEVADPASSGLVVAEEHVMRGADWLGQRWRGRGPRFEHMAVARRAAGLTQAQFSELWTSPAGRVRTGSATTTTAIPDEARDLAYAQNHPVPRAGGDWPYDAVNEVWIDDLDALRRRVEWFAEILAGGTEDDLVRENRFVVAREEVVVSPQHA